MFSVPGWNVSAALKTQTEQLKSSTASNSIQNGDAKAPKSKKRKRGHGKEKEDVNGGNMVEMWERVVEGKKVVPKDMGSGANREKVAKKRKRDKKEKEGEGDKKDEIDGLKDETEKSSYLPDTTTSPCQPEKKKPKKSKPAKTPTEPTSVSNSSSIPQIPPPIPPNQNLTPLQKSMRQKLASARFRHLNESLYTTPSTSSLSLFTENPEMFTEYHLGFAQQVDVWPENPVDGYVAAVLERGKVRERDPWREKRRGEKKGKGKGKGRDVDVDGDVDDGKEELGKGGVKALPRGLKGVSTIADLGCGVASLSLRLQPHLKQLNLSIRSFDLAKPSGPAHDLVTVADISSLPLPDASVDIAIFCLALMGTNWIDFIDEAWRVLRWKGELWVAEIKSRFGRVERRKGKGQPPPNSVGSLRKDKKAPKKGKSKEEPEGMRGSDDEAELAVEVDGAVDIDVAKQETDVSAFVEVLRKRGFVLDGEGEKAVDKRNKMFVKMVFVKGLAPVRGKNVKEGGGRFGGSGGNGMKMGAGKRFIDREGEEEEDVEAEKGVLKPCVYKLR